MTLVGARLRGTVALLLGTLVAGLLPGAATAAADPPVRVASTINCAWPQYGYDHRHSFRQLDECTAITPTSVSTLLPQWLQLTPDNVTASPAVVGNRAYVGDWTGRFYALDTTAGPGFGRPVWTFDITDLNKVAFGRIVSSAAVVRIGNRRVVLFGGGATLYALDAATGKELASVCLDPRSNPRVRCRGSERDIEIETSPAVVRRGGQTWVVVGMDVHNARNVGRTGVIGFRLLRHRDDTWELAPDWKFDPEAHAAYRGADLLTRGSGTGTGCAGVWSSPAIDVANDLVFFGTASCPVDNVSFGENVYAVRLSDGSPVWHYEAPRPGRSARYDDDFGASANLLPGGMVGIGGKDGVYYALDRRTGALRWKTQAGQAGRLTMDFAVGGMIGSAAVGTVNGEPAIFATTAISTPLEKPLDEEFLAVDPGLLEDPGRMFSLHAIRARDGAVLWRTPFSRQSYGSASFANGVVLVPSTFSFTIQAFHADTGAPLWAMPTFGASSSTPVVVGDTVYLGTGTRTTDVEYKAFGASALDVLLGASPLSPLSGVMAFRLPAS